ncbi:carbon monoxide dehydrogenase subunit G [Pigmentiphaga soli]|uniref:Carbon monoxide dehydrogenase subunit G n=1 Tax=Pigmentiphaga soli TaxID=1007095 RepID=A0ABP8GTE7_9BURK
MDIGGTQVIAAPRAEVWEALNSPEVLKTCIPGCERIEADGDDRYKVTMVAAIGPIRARFLGTLTLTDVQPPTAYSLLFEGNGGVAGFGKGGASVSLADLPEGTSLSYTAQAQVGGKLAQIGSRLIDTVAKKLAADFFRAFEKHFEARAAAGGDAVRAQ